jgi:hypothetical protein
MAKKLIVLKGSATYGMTALGLDAGIMIQQRENPLALTGSKLIEKIKEKLPSELDETNYANFLILKELAEMNREAVFLSDRGDENENLEFATSNLGGLVRKYKDQNQNVADLGSGELKSSKTNMGGHGAGLAKLIFKDEPEKVGFVADSLKESIITHVYFTGSWRTNDKGYDIDELKRRAAKNKKNESITFVRLEQKEEAQLASEAWSGAVKAMIKEGKRNSYVDVLFPPEEKPKIYDIKYHEHGNGSMQGDLVESSKSLKDLKNTLKRVEDKDKNDAFISWWDGNVTVLGPSVSERIKSIERIERDGIKLKPFYGGGARKNQRRRSRRGQRQQKNRRSRRGSRSQKRNKQSKNRRSKRRGTKASKRKRRN